MRKALFFALVILSIVLLLPVVAVRADGPTVTPVPVISTPAPQNVAVVSEVSGIAYMALGAILGGGGLLIGLLILVRSIMSSPVLITALENLASSWPAPTRELIHDVGYIAAEATDGVPYADKKDKAVGPIVGMAKSIKDSSLNG